MIFDVNSWTGAFPFRRLKETTPERLLARLDRCRIAAAAVGSAESLLYRNVQPANESLAEALAPYRDRLFPMATINPAYPKWERDLDICVQSFNMKGVRLFPQYHDYDASGALAQKAVRACAERGLPVAFYHRIEDPRQQHWMDPGKVVEAREIAELVAAVPGAAILYLNARGVCRSPLWTRRELRERRWYVDLSLDGVHYQLHRNMQVKRGLADLIDEGGAEHLLFGSHVPFSYPGAALVKRAVLQVNRDVLDRISYRNAMDLFGIEGAPEGAIVGGGK